MKPIHQLGSVYPWERLISSINWDCLNAQGHTDAFHLHQPARRLWKQISDTWPSEYTIARLKQETGWDRVEGMHYDSRMICFKECYNIDIDPTLATRYWIALQDWKPGHSLTIGDEVIYNWKAGDVYSWDNRTPHRGDNVGPHTRYLLLLTKYSSNENTS